MREQGLRKQSREHNDGEQKVGAGAVVQITEENMEQGEVAEKRKKKQEGEGGPVIGK